MMKRINPKAWGVTVNVEVWCVAEEPPWGDVERFAAELSVKQEVQYID